LNVDTSNLLQRQLHQELRVPLLGSCYVYYRYEPSLPVSSRLAEYQESESEVPPPSRTSFELGLHFVNFSIFFVDIDLGQSGIECSSASSQQDREQPPSARGALQAFKRHDDG
jgi:hypothetical protein